MSATLGRATVLTTLVVGVVAVSCTFNSDQAAPSAPPARTVPLGDLEDAVARWHHMTGTVTYRTQRQQPGLPSSAHQCLRRFVDDRQDIPIGLAKCDPGGIARLVWDPPTRWRLEVTEASRAISATVVGGRSAVCDLAGDGYARCRRHGDQLLGAFPFHELVADVRTVLRELDIDPLGSVTITHRAVGDASADCFERASGGASAQWCFGIDGTLLALELRAEGRSPTLVEMQHISSDVRWPFKV